MRDYERPPKTIPRVKGSHEADWARCCKAGEQPSACFDYSGPFNEVAILGNIAKRMNDRLMWDGKNMKVTNRPEANQYVRPPRRKGWELDS